MQKSVLVLFILLLLVVQTVQPVKAGMDDVDMTKVLPTLIVDGFDMILISIGNQMYAAIGANNATEAQAILTRSLITKNNFLENKSLQDAKDFNAFWYIVFFIGYVVIGACFVMKEKAFPEDGFYNEETYGNAYLETVIGGVILYIFYLYGLDFVFKFEEALSYGITLESMDMITVVRTSPFMHMLLAGMFLIVNAFFLIRYVYLVIISTYFLLFVALYRIPILNAMIYIMYLYAIVFIFVRPIIVIILMAGTGAVTSVPEELGLAEILYIIVLLIVVVATVLVMISPFLYIYLKSSSARRLYRLVK